MSHSPFWLLLLALLTLARLANAQPTLVVERPQPYRYISQSISLRAEVFSFALPGRRYLHCGTADAPASPRGHTEVMLSLTKANGDTVRYVRLNRTPLGGAFDYVMGAVLNPDYTLTVWVEHLVSTATPTSRDSLSLFTLDTLGRLRSQRSLPFVGIDYPYHLVRTGNGYLAAANPLAFPGTSDLSPKPGLWKMDRQGNVVWRRDWRSRGYGGVGAIEDVIPHPDGSYLALGTCDNGAPYTPGQSTRGRMDYYLVKFRHNGDTLWTRRFGVSGDSEYGTRLRLCPDGGYAILGSRYAGTGPSPKENGQVLKVDSLGRIQWTSTISNANFDWPYYLLQPLANGDIVFGGRQLQVPTTPAYPQGWLRCFTPTGTPRWEYQRAIPNYAVQFYTMVNHADGSAYLAGSTGTGTTSQTLRVYAYFATFAGVGVPYAPDLCATPPTAAFAPAFAPRGDSLLLLDLSRPGPRYAELVSWHWDFGDGTSFDGPTPPWHRYATPPGPGLQVRLTVTNNLGCQHSYALRPLASRAQLLQAGFSLYPNPATATVTVELDGLRPQSDVPVEVRNTLGQVVLRTTAPLRQGKSIRSLDINLLSPGVYIVQLCPAEGTVVKRFIKQ